MRPSASPSVAIPTLLLLASAAVAQDASTTSASVVPSPVASPSLSSEQVYTIQTDTTAFASDPWACYQDCLMPPCPPLACTSSRGVGSATPVPLPRPMSESVVSEITDASLSTVSGFMSIPAGETPISSSAIVTSATDSPTASASPTRSSAGTRTSSGPPQATSNAAVLNAKADQIPLVAAIAGALVLL